MSDYAESDHTARSSELDLLYDETGRLHPWLYAETDAAGNQVIYQREAPPPEFNAQRKNHNSKGGAPAPVTRGVPGGLKASNRSDAELKKSLNEARDPGGREKIVLGSENRIVASSEPVGTSVPEAELRKRQQLASGENLPPPWKRSEEAKRRESDIRTRGGPTKKQVEEARLRRLELKYGAQTSRIQRAYRNMVVRRAFMNTRSKKFQEQLAKQSLLDEEADRREQERKEADRRRQAAMDGAGKQHRAAAKIQASFRGKKQREQVRARRKQMEAAMSGGPAILANTYDKVDTVQLGWLLRPTAKSIVQRRQQVAEWVKKTHAHQLRLSKAEAELEAHKKKHAELQDMAQLARAGAGAAATSAARSTALAQQTQQTDRNFLSQVDNRVKKLENQPADIFKALQRIGQIEDRMRADAEQAARNLERVERENQRPVEQLKKKLAQVEAALTEATESMDLERIRDLTRLGSLENIVIDALEGARQHAMQDAELETAQRADRTRAVKETAAMTTRALMAKEADWNLTQPAGVSLDKAAKAIEKKDPVSKLRSVNLPYAQKQSTRAPPNRGTSPGASAAGASGSSKQRVHLTCGANSILFRPVSRIIRENPEQREVEAAMGGSPDDDPDSPPASPSRIPKVYLKPYTLPNLPAKPFQIERKRFLTEAEVEFESAPMEFYDDPRDDPMERVKVRAEKTNGFASNRKAYADGRSAVATQLRDSHPSRGVRGGPVAGARGNPQEEVHDLTSEHFGMNMMAARAGVVDAAKAKRSTDNGLADDPTAERNNTYSQRKQLDPRRVSTNPDPAKRVSIREVEARAALERERHQEAMDMATAGFKANPEDVRRNNSKGDVLSGMIGEAASGSNLQYVYDPVTKVVVGVPAPGTQRVEIDPRYVSTTKKPWEYSYTTSVEVGGGLKKPSQLILGSRPAPQYGRGGTVQQVMGPSGAPEPGLINVVSTGEPMQSKEEMMAFWGFAGESTAPPAVESKAAGGKQARVSAGVRKQYVGPNNDYVHGQYAGHLGLEGDEDPRNARKKGVKSRVLVTPTSSSSASSSETDARRGRGGRAGAARSRSGSRTRRNNLMASETSSAFSRSHRTGENDTDGTEGLAMKSSSSASYAEHDNPHTQFLIAMQEELESKYHQVLSTAANREGRHRTWDMQDGCDCGEELYSTPSEDVVSDHDDLVVPANALVDSISEDGFAETEAIPFFAEEQLLEDELDEDHQEEVQEDQHVEHRHAVSSSCSSSPAGTLRSPSSKAALFFEGEHCMGDEQNNEQNTASTPTGAKQEDDGAASGPAEDATPAFFMTPAARWQPTMTFGPNGVPTPVVPQSYQPFNFGQSVGGSSPPGTSGAAGAPGSPNGFGGSSLLGGGPAGSRQQQEMSEARWQMELMLQQHARDASELEATNVGQPYARIGNGNGAGTKKSVTFLQTGSTSGQHAFQTLLPNPHVDLGMGGELANMYHFNNPNNVAYVTGTSTARSSSSSASGAAGASSFAPQARGGVGQATVASSMKTMISRPGSSGANANFITPDLVTMNPNVFLRSQADLAVPPIDEEAGYEYDARSWATADGGPPESGNVKAAKMLAEAQHEKSDRLRTLAANELELQINALSGQLDALSRRMTQHEERGAKAEESERAARSKCENAKVLASIGLHPATSTSSGTKDNSNAGGASKNINKGGSSSSSEVENEETARRIISSQMSPLYARVSTNSDKQDEAREREIQQKLTALEHRAMERDLERRTRGDQLNAELALVHKQRSERVKAAERQLGKLDAEEKREEVDWIALETEVESQKQLRETHAKRLAGKKEADYSGADWNFLATVAQANTRDKEHLQTAKVRMQGRLWRDQMRLKQIAKHRNGILADQKKKSGEEKKREEEISAAKDRLVEVYKSVDADDQRAKENLATELKKVEQKREMREAKQAEIANAQLLEDSEKLALARAKQLELKMEEEKWARIRQEHDRALKIGAKEQYELQQKKNMLTAQLKIVQNGGVALADEQLRSFLDITDAPLERAKKLRDLKQLEEATDLVLREKSAVGHMLKGEMMLLERRAEESKLERLQIQLEREKVQKEWAQLELAKGGGGYAYGNVQNASLFGPPVSSSQPFLNQAYMKKQSSKGSRSAADGDAGRTAAGIMNQGRSTSPAGASGAPSRLGAAPGFSSSPTATLGANYMNLTGGSPLSPQLGGMSFSPLGAPRQLGSGVVLSGSSSATSAHAKHARDMDKLERELQKAQKLQQDLEQNLFRAGQFASNSSTSPTTTAALAGWPSINTKFVVGAFSPGSPNLPFTSQLLNQTSALSSLQSAMEAINVQSHAAVALRAERATIRLAELQEEIARVRNEYDEHCFQCAEAKKEELWQLSKAFQRKVQQQPNRKDHFEHELQRKAELAERHAETEQLKLDFALKTRLSSLVAELARQQAAAAAHAAAAQHAKKVEEILAQGHKTAEEHQEELSRLQKEYNAQYEQSASDIAREKLRSESKKRREEMEQRHKSSMEKLHSDLNEARGLVSAQIAAAPHLERIAFLEAQLKNQKADHDVRLKALQREKQAGEKRIHEEYARKLAEDPEHKENIEAALKEQELQLHEKFEQEKSRLSQQFEEKRRKLAEDLEQQREASEVLMSSARHQSRLGEIDRKLADAEAEHKAHVEKLAKQMIAQQKELEAAYGKKIEDDQAETGGEHKQKLMEELLREKSKLSKEFESEKARANVEFLTLKGDLAQAREKVQEELEKAKKGAHQAHDANIEKLRLEKEKEQKDFEKRMADLDKAFEEAKKKLAEDFKQKIDAAGTAEKKQNLEKEWRRREAMEQKKHEATKKRMEAEHQVRVAKLQTLMANEKAASEAKKHSADFAESEKLRRGILEMKLRHARELHHAQLLAAEKKLSQELAKLVADFKFHHADSTDGILDADELAELDKLKKALTRQHAVEVEHLEAALAAREQRLRTAFEKNQNDALNLHRNHLAKQAKAAKQASLDEAKSHASNHHEMQMEQLAHDHAKEHEELEAKLRKRAERTAGKWTVKHENELHEELENLNKQHAERVAQLQSNHEKEHEGLLGVHEQEGRENSSRRRSEALQKEVSVLMHEKDEEIGLAEVAYKKEVAALKKKAADELVKLELEGKKRIRDAALAQKSARKHAAAGEDEAEAGAAPKVVGVDVVKQELRHEKQLVHDRLLDELDLARHRFEDAKREIDRKYGEKVAQADTRAAREQLEKDKKASLKRFQDQLAKLETTKSAEDAKLVAAMAKKKQALEEDFARKFVEDDSAREQDLQTQKKLELQVLDDRLARDRGAIEEKHGVETKRLHTEHEQWLKKAEKDGEAGARQKAIEENDKLHVQHLRDAEARFVQGELDADKARAEAENEIEEVYEQDKKEARAAEDLLKKAEEDYAAAKARLAERQEKLKAKRAQAYSALLDKIDAEDLAAKNKVENEAAAKAKAKVDAEAAKALAAKLAAEQQEAARERERLAKEAEEAHAKLEAMYKAKMEEEAHKKEEHEAELRQQKEALAKKLALQQLQQKLEAEAKQRALEREHAREQAELEAREKKEELERKKQQQMEALKGHLDSHESTRTEGVAKVERDAAEQLRRAEEEARRQSRAAASIRKSRSEIEAELAAKKAEIEKKVAEDKAKLEENFAQEKEKLEEEHKRVVALQEKEAAMASKAKQDEEARKVLAEQLKREEEEAKLHSARLHEQMEQQHREMEAEARKQMEKAGADKAKIEDEMREAKKQAEENLAREKKALREKTEAQQAKLAAEHEAEVKILEAKHKYEEEERLRREQQEKDLAAREKAHKEEDERLKREHEEHERKFEAEMRRKMEEADEEERAEHEAALAKQKKELEEKMKAERAALAEKLREEQEKVTRQHEEDARLSEERMLAERKAAAESIAKAKSKAQEEIDEYEEKLREEKDRREEEVKRRKLVEEDFRKAVAKHKIELAAAKSSAHLESAGAARSSAEAHAKKMMEEAKSHLDEEFLLASTKLEAEAAEEVKRLEAEQKRLEEDFIAAADEEYQRALKELKDEEEGGSSQEQEQEAGPTSTSMSPAERAVEEARARRDAFTPQLEDIKSNMARASRELIARRDALQTKYEQDLQKLEREYSEELVKLAKTQEKAREADSKKAAKEAELRKLQEERDAKEQKHRREAEEAKRALDERHAKLVRDVQAGLAHQHLDEEKEKMEAEKQRLETELEQAREALTREHQLEEAKLLGVYEEMHDEWEKHIVAEKEHLEKTVEALREKQEAQIGALKEKMKQYRSDLDAEKAGREAEVLKLKKDLVALQKTSSANVDELSDMHQAQIEEVRALGDAMLEQERSARAESERRLVEMHRAEAEAREQELERLLAVARDENVDLQEETLRRIEDAKRTHEAEMRRLFQEELDVEILRATANLDERVAALLREREEERDRMNAAFSERMDVEKRNHREECDKLKEEADAALEELRREYEDKIQHSQEDFQHHEEEWRRQKQLLDIQVAKERGELDEKLRETERKLNLEIETTKARERLAELDQHTKEGIDAGMEKMTKQHEEEIQDIVKNSERELAELRSEFHNRMQEAGFENEHRLSLLEQELEEKKAAIEKMKQEEMERANSEFLLKQEKLRKEHHTAARLAAGTADAHREEQERTAQQEYERRDKELWEEFEAKRERMEKEMKQRVAAEGEALTAEMEANVRAEYDKEVEKMQAGLVQERAKLRAELEHERHGIRQSVNKIKRAAATAAIRALIRTKKLTARTLAPEEQPAAMRSTNAAGEVEKARPLVTPGREQAELIRNLFEEQNKRLLELERQEREKANQMMERMIEKHQEDVARHIEASIPKQYVPAVDPEQEKKHAAEVARLETRYEELQKQAASKYEELQQQSASKYESLQKESSSKYEDLQKQSMSEYQALQKQLTSISAEKEALKRKLRAGEDEANLRAMSLEDQLAQFEVKLTKEKSKGEEEARKRAKMIAEKDEELRELAVEKSRLMDSREEDKEKAVEEAAAAVDRARADALKEAHESLKEEEERRFQEMMAKQENMTSEELEKFALEMSERENAHLSRAEQLEKAHEKAQALMAKQREVRRVQKEKLLVKSREMMDLTVEHDSDDDATKQQRREMQQALAQRMMDAMHTMQKRMMTLQEEHDAEVDDLDDTIYKLRQTAALREAEFQAREAELDAQHLETRERLKEVEAERLLAENRARELQEFVYFGNDSPEHEKEEIENAPKMQVLTKEDAEYRLYLNREADRLNSEKAAHEQDRDGYNEKLFQDRIRFAEAADQMDKERKEYIERFEAEKKQMAEEYAKLQKEMAEYSEQMTNALAAAGGSAEGGTATAVYDPETGSFLTLEMIKQQQSMLQQALEESQLKVDELKLQRDEAYQKQELAKEASRGVISQLAGEKEELEQILSGRGIEVQQGGPPGSSMAAGTARTIASGAVRDEAETFTMTTNKVEVDVEQTTTTSAAPAATIRPAGVDESQITLAPDAYQNALEQTREVKRRAVERLEVYNAQYKEFKQQVKDGTLSGEAAEKRKAELDAISVENEKTSRAELADLMRAQEVQEVRRASVRASVVSPSGAGGGATSESAGDTTSRKSHAELEREEILKSHMEKIDTHVEEEHKSGKNLKKLHRKIELLTDLETRKRQLFADHFHDHEKEEVDPEMISEFANLHKEHEKLHTKLFNVAPKSPGVSGTRAGSAGASPMASPTSPLVYYNDADPAASSSQAASIFSRLVQKHLQENPGGLDLTTVSAFSLSSATEEAKEQKINKNE